MHFQINMSEKGGHHIFRDKQETNKVLLMFLGLKVVSER